MLVCDNQQVTKVGWFTAILEGKANIRNTKSHNQQVRIINTDTDIIKRCEDFLKENHIYFSTSVNKRKNCKPIYEISISNNSNFSINYSKLLYDLIDPYLECRRDEYQTILGSSQSIRGPSVDQDWLIGIYEAEGFLSLTTSYQGYAFYEIGMCNTNQRIIEKTIMNLRAMNCPYYVQNKGPYKKEDHYREAKAIRIVGMMRCEKFLRATEGKWMASRNLKRSSLMSEFIESRKVMKMKEPFTERQRRILQTMKDLNC